MTKDADLTAGQKYVSGYYNGNRWPIQLVISRLNITLHIPPGEFIKDKQGRKINDPFFELYAKNGQLSRELSDTPVAVVTVPNVTATTAPVANDGQSVRSVTEFKLDEKGIRQPVIPQPQVIPQQAINKASFTAMSMDEARRAGLIKKVREVPEDYGVADSNSASPPRTAPQIRYAMDTDQAAKPTSDLPKQLQAALPKQNLQERQSMQQALAKGAKTTELLDSETGFLNVASQNIPKDVGITVGPATVDSTDALPAPNLEEALPEPPEEEMPIPEPTVKPVKVPQRTKFVCLECHKEVKHRVELLVHAKKDHPDKVSAIMAPYPA